MYDQRSARSNVEGRKRFAFSARSSFKRVRWRCSTTSEQLASRVHRVPSTMDGMRYRPHPQAHWVVLLRRARKLSLPNPIVWLSTNRETECRLTESPFGSEPRPLIYSDVHLSLLICFKEGTLEILNDYWMNAVCLKRYWMHKRKNNSAESESEANKLTNKELEPKSPL